MTGSDQKLIDSFLHTCRGRMAAVILGSSVNGLSYIRSLGRRGVPVLCADHNPGIARHSRYGSFSLLAKEPGEAIPGERAADRLFARLREAGAKVAAFGSADEWQVYIAHRAAADPPPFESLAPSQQTIDCIVDKQAQYECALRSGIAVPTFANALDVLREPAAWSLYPAIVKPRWSHSGRGPIGGKAVRVESPQALARQLQSLDQAVDLGAYIVQKVVDGADDALFAYLGCWDDRGVERSWLIKRKLRQHPPQFGDGCFDATCEAAAVADAARRLLSAMNYRGLVGVEFKRDSHTGEFSLIEINPRTVSTNQLAVTAGVDFPWHAWQLIANRGAAGTADLGHTPGSYRRGVHHMHEDRFLRAFLHARKRGEMTLRDFARAIAISESFALWSRRDPWPFLFTVGGWFRAGLGRSRSAEPAPPRPHAQPEPPMATTRVAGGEAA